MPQFPPAWYFLHPTDADCSLYCQHFRPLNITVVGGGTSLGTTSGGGQIWNQQDHVDSHGRRWSTWASTLRGNPESLIPSTDVSPVSPNLGAQWVQAILALLCFPSDRKGKDGLKQRVGVCVCFPRSSPGKQIQRGLDPIQGLPLDTTRAAVRDTTCLWQGV